MNPYDQANDMLDEFSAIKLVDGVTLAIGTPWSDTADYRKAEGTGRGKDPYTSDRTITIQAEQVDRETGSGVQYIAMWMSAREATRIARALLDAAHQVTGPSFDG